MEDLELVVLEEIKKIFTYNIMINLKVIVKIPKKSIKLLFL